MDTIAREMAPHILYGTLGEDLMRASEAVHALYAPFRPAVSPVERTEGDETALLREALSEIARPSYHVKTNAGEPTHYVGGCETLEQARYLANQVLGGVLVPELTKEQLDAFAPVGGSSEGPEAHDWERVRRSEDPDSGDRALWRCRTCSRCSWADSPDGPESLDPDVPCRGGSSESEAEDA